MSEVSDTTLKTYFETGDVPTSAQFVDLIDSKLNRTDLSETLLASTAAGSGSDLIGLVGAASGYTLADWHGEVIPAPTIGLSPDNTAAANSAAMTAWAATAPIGTKIQFGGGAYQFATGFTLPDGAHLAGNTHWIGTNSGSEHTALEFTGTTGTFITALGLNLSNITIRGYVANGDAYSAGTVGLSTSGNVYAYNATVSGFATGWIRTGGYYLKWVNGEFRLCNVCFTGADLYNTAFIGTKFNEFNTGVTFSGGSGPISFIGVSVEKFTTAFVQVLSGASSLINFTNGYIENYPAATVWPGLSGTHYAEASVFVTGTSALRIRDGFFSLNGVDRLVNAGAIGSLHAVGNTIYWTGSTPGTDIPDTIFYGTSAGQIDIRNHWLVDPSAAGVNVASSAIRVAPGIYQDEDVNLFWNGAIRNGTFLYDFDVDGGAVGSVSLGTIPDNATITQAWYEVITEPTSGGAATIAFTTSQAANQLVTATAYDNAAFAAGMHAAIPDGAVANFVAKTTALRVLRITIAGADLTAGKIRFWYEYVVSE